VTGNETSQQIEASKSTFARKDTGNERIFCLELPASHTYHRYHHDIPSFMSQHAAYGNVPLCAVFACPNPDADTYGMEKGGPSTVTAGSLRGKATQS